LSFANVILPSASAIQNEIVFPPNLFCKRFFSIIDKGYSVSIVVKTSIISLLVTTFLRFSETILYFGVEKKSYSSTSNSMRNKVSFSFTKGKIRQSAVTDSPE